MSPMGMDSLYEPKWGEGDDHCMFHHEDEFADFYSIGTSSIQCKKVYVVLWYETLHSTEVIGVFTSEELAKKCLEKYKKHGGGYIKCVELNKEC